MARLDNRAIEEFRSKVTGEVLKPGDPRFEAACTAIAIAARHCNPALFVQCASMADVMQCLSFADHHNLRISVQGYGRKFQEESVLDDGLIMNIWSMKWRPNPGDVSEF